MLVRRLCTKDQEAFIFFLMNDPAWAAAVGSEAVTDTTAWNFFCKVIGHYQIKPYGLCGVFVGKNNRLVGLIGAMYDPIMQSAEYQIAVSTKRAEFGRVREAVFQYYFGEFKLVNDPGYAFVSCENLASIRFLRKLGFESHKEFENAKGIRHSVWRIDQEPARTRRQYALQKRA
jgi:RimJ/RimL family protein N-acetyltransferase